MSTNPPGLDKVKFGWATITGYAATVGALVTSIVTAASDSHLADLSPQVWAYIGAGALFLTNLGRQYQAGKQNEASGSAPPV